MDRTGLLQQEQKERRFIQQAQQEAANRRCSRCHGALEARFTWHPMRPYYFTCPSCAKEDEAEG